MPRVGMDFGYFRRWFGNFLAMDNRANTAADFDPLQHHRADRPAPA